MSYRLEYNSTATDWQWWLMEAAFWLVALLVAWLLLRPFLRERRGPLVRLWPLALCLLLIASRVALRSSANYYVTRNFFRYYGPYTTIDGVVKNYRVIQTSSNVGEQFDVSDIHFGYMDLSQWTCFHRAAANGGPIREGLSVRISYTVRHVMPCIVKLEVAEERH